MLTYVTEQTSRLHRLPKFVFVGMELRCAVSYAVSRSFLYEVHFIRTLFMIVKECFQEAMKKYFNSVILTLDLLKPSVSN